MKVVEPQASPRKSAPDRSRALIRVESVDPGEFARLGEEWNALLESSPSNCVFLTWEWLYTWWQHMGDGRRLDVLTARDAEDRLIGIAPLALRRAEAMRLRPFPTLEFLGSGNVGSDYLDLIVGDEGRLEASEALADAIIARNTVAELSQLRSPSTVTEVLAPAMERSGWTLDRTRINMCPHIDLSGKTWDSYLASLGSKHRYNFRRRLRNLSRDYEVDFRPVSSYEECREALGTLVALHNARWDERGGSTAFHESSLITFHEDFTRTALARGWLRLFVLRLDARPAALLYGLRYGDVFYFYQSAFDPAYASHSVGLVVMGLSIQHAIAEGAREFDLLHGDERYKSLWASQSRELSRIRLFPPTVEGATARRLTGLRSVAGRVVRRVQQTG